MKKQYSIFYLLLLIFLLEFNNVSAQYAWIQRASIGGLGRLGPYGFSISGKGYIGGGSYNFVCMNDFWEYDPTANTWTQKNDAPVYLNAAGYFVINGEGYITGGDQCGSGNNVQLCMYDPSSNTWTSKASYPGTPIYGGACFAIGTKGYYGIGNGDEGTGYGPYYQEFYEYDAIADSWTQKASFPGTARYGVNGIALNSEGYVGFGINENVPILFNDWWQYDPSSNAWTAKANYPDIVRDYPMSFTINDSIYVGTGNNNGSTLTDFYEYDTNHDVWIQIANYGGGYRWAAIAFSIGSIGYFGAGAGTDVTNDINDFWEYAPSTPPVASFQSSDSAICTNDCINFSDHSTSATSWQWFFPGASPFLSTDENPQNICYSAAGNYDVLLIASNSVGSDTLYISKYITVNTSPSTPVIKQVGNTLYCNTDSSYTSYQWYYSNTQVPSRASRTSTGSTTCAGCKHIKMFTNIWICTV